MTVLYHAPVTVQKESFIPEIFLPVAFDAHQDSDGFPEDIRFQNPLRILFK
jgi:hypothetical protein